MADILVDDFEDGDIVAPIDWDGWSGGTQYFSAVSDSVRGSYAGSLADSNGNNPQVSVSKSTTEPTDGNVEAWLEPQDGNLPQYERYRFRVNGDNGEVAGIELFHNGDINVRDGGSWVSTGASWSAQTTYKFVFEIDWDTGDYYLLIDGTQYGPYSTSSGGVGVEDVILEVVNFYEDTAMDLRAGEITVRGATTPTPDAPSSLSTTVVSGDEIDLEWTDNADNEDGFYIYRATGSGSSVGDYTQIDDVPPDTSRYTDSGLLDGEEYFYRVSAYNDGGESDLSNESDAVTVLPAPTNLSVDAVRAAEVDLSWTATHDNGDTRVDYKRSSASTWTTFGTVSRTTETVTLTGLLNGEEYDARVVAQTEHVETEDQ